MPSMNQQNEPDYGFYNQQLELFRQNLQHELQRAVRYGGERVAPLDISNSIEHQRQQIARVKAWLRQAGISVADLPEELPLEDTFLSQQGRQADVQRQNVSAIPGALVGTARSCRISVQMVNSALPLTMRLGFLALLLVLVTFVGRILLAALPALLALGIQLAVILMFIGLMLGRNSTVLWELVGRLVGGIMGMILGLLEAVFRLPINQGGAEYQVLRIDLNLFVPGRPPIPVQLRTQQPAQFIPDGSQIAVVGRTSLLGQLQASQIATPTQTIQGWREPSWLLPNMLLWGFILWLAFELVLDGSVPAWVWPSAGGNPAPTVITAASQQLADAPSPPQVSTPSPRPSVISPTSPPPAPTVRYAVVVGVTPRRLNLRDGPSAQSTVLTGVPEGSRVELIGEVELRGDERWQQVRFNDQTGWVSADFLSIQP